LRDGNLVLPTGLIIHGVPKDVSVRIVQEQSGGDLWEVMEAGSDSLTLGGLVILVLAGSGALAVSLMHSRSAREIMTVGSASLAVGVAITLGAIGAHSLAMFFSGAAIAGIGFGTGLQGAIRSVVPVAAPHERAGVLSTTYVVAYLAMGLPAIFGGISVVYGDGLFATAREYGLGVIGRDEVTRLIQSHVPTSHSPTATKMTDDRRLVDHLCVDHPFRQCIQSLAAVVASWTTAAISPSRTRSSATWQTAAHSCRPIAMSARRSCSGCSSSSTATSPTSR
jgi:hypothetical protein